MKIHFWLCVSLIIACCTVATLGIGQPGVRLDERSASFSLEAYQVRLFYFPKKLGEEVIRVNLTGDYDLQQNSDLMINAGCGYIPIDPFVSIDSKRADLVETKNFFYCDAGRGDHTYWFILVSSYANTTNVSFVIDTFQIETLEYNQQYTFDTYNATSGCVAFKVNPKTNVGSSISISLPANYETVQRTETDPFFYQGYSYNTYQTTPTWYIIVGNVQDPAFNITVHSQALVDLNDVANQTVNVNLAPGATQVYRYAGGNGKNVALRVESDLELSLAREYTGRWMDYEDDSMDRFIFVKNPLENDQSGTITFLKTDLISANFETLLTYQCDVKSYIVVRFPNFTNSNFALVNGTGNYAEVKYFKEGSKVNSFVGQNTRIYFGSMKYAQFILTCTQATEITFQVNELRDENAYNVVTDGQSFDVRMEANKNPYTFSTGQYPVIIIDTNKTIDGNLYPYGGLKTTNNGFVWSVLNYHTSLKFEFSTAFPALDVKLTFHLVDYRILNNNEETFIDASEENPVPVKVVAPKGPRYFLSSSDSIYSQVDDNTAYGIVSNSGNLTLNLSPAIVVTSGVIFTVPAGSNSWYLLPASAGKSGNVHYTAADPQSLLRVDSPLYGGRIDYKLDRDGYLLALSDTNDSHDWYFTFRGNTVDMNMTLTYQETNMLCPLEGCVSIDTASSDTAASDTKTGSTTVSPTDNNSSTTLSPTEEDEGSAGNILKISLGLALTATLLLL